MKVRCDKCWTVFDVDKQWSTCPHNLLSHPIRPARTVLRNKDSSSYELWKNMTRRCRHHPDYAGRGIKVCERWLTFRNFLKDMGERPDGMTLERKDNNGNYDPDNCKWATRAQQVRNCRRNVNVTLNGKTQCVADWAFELGVPPKRIYARLKILGWGVTSALLVPASRRGKANERRP